MIRAVFWDFGGVILSSPFEAFNAYERANGLPTDFIRGVNSRDPDTNARLMAEQRMIQRQERAYLADGRLSRWERRDLYGDLRDANRHIYNQTHDAQTRH